MLLDSLSVRSQRVDQSSIARCRIMDARTNRILKEKINCSKDLPEEIIAGPRDEANLFVWDAHILGPKDSAYEGGVFTLELKFTEEYPNKPPIIKFLSKMFHPNLYMDGSICLDVLSTKYIPSMDIRTILLSIQSLLIEPNPDSPANAVAAELLITNYIEFQRQVKETVDLSVKELSEKFE